MINAMSGYQPYTSANSVGNVLPGGLSLCSIMVLVLMERYGIYQDLIRSAYDDMQARNNLLKDMNKALSVLRTNRPTDEKAAKDYGTFVDSQGTIDGANSEGEMAMIHLQGLLGKHNDVAALMSNLLSRDQKIKEMIIGNFR